MTEKQNRQKQTNKIIKMIKMQKNVEITIYYSY